MKGRAWGFELDGTFRAAENFLLTAGVSYNDTEIKDDSLAVGICAQCTVLDPIVVIGGTNRALVDGNPFPNAPDWIFDVTARWGMPVGNSGEIFVFTDWAYQGETNFFLYESREFVTDGQIEGGLRIGYARDRRPLGGRPVRPEHYRRGQSEGRHRLQQQYRASSTSRAPSASRRASTSSRFRAPGA